MFFRWFLKISNYGQRQYICLRQYEDKALTKSPKGKIVHLLLKQIYETTLNIAKN